MRFLAVLLFPFSVLYDFITRFRNHVYNIGYKRSFSFDMNVIAVGNLSVGGTGKTPMVEYIARLLNKKYQITTLSRGYGRRTKGFKLAGDHDTAETIGDEPYQMFNKFSDINVVVCEDRALAIPFILTEKPETEVILLDDAFQHRSVKAGLNILLTDYSQPFFNDWVLPFGRLRESRIGAKRADVIVVTKCPHDIHEPDRQEIIKEIRKYNAEAEVYFTGIKYAQLEAIDSATELNKNLIAFSGIAKPELFVENLSANYNLKDHINFKDHHNYSKKEVQELIELLDVDTSLVTTEKDMVKLLKPELADLIQGISVFYLPIEAYFIKDGKRFDDQIQNSIRKYSY